MFCIAGHSINKLPHPGFPPPLNCPDFPVDYSIQSCRHPIQPSLHPQVKAKAYFEPVVNVTVFIREILPFIFFLVIDLHVAIK